MPVYVVVSASRNLGLAYVRLLAKETDNTVFALARNLGEAPDLIALASECKNVHPLKLDLLDASSIKEAADTIEKITGGPIDVLIHNGAIMMHPLAQLTLDNFNNTKDLEDYMLLSFKANTIGAIHTINAFLPLLLKGQTKKVLVVSSTMGSPQYAIETESQHATAYSISKAALNMAIAKYAISANLREAGLVIVGVNPGFMKSHTFPGSEEFYEKSVQRIRAKNPDFKVVGHEESARGQLKLLKMLTPADSGSFLNWNGKKISEKLF